MKRIIIMLFVGFIMAAASFSQTNESTLKPEKGFVPDAVTAIKIAEAIWLPIYGKSIYKEKPFQVELKDGIWYVKGSLRKGWVGGVAHAEIAQETGCILNIYHTK